MNDTNPRDTATDEACDVLVVGGGPGGSTVATLLARRGLKVIQLEKNHHPRFHIGESLLPMNLPVMERLGVLEKVRALGVYKAGADFDADNERGYNTFAFARALGESPPHAFQVWRADFDKMLFEHARENGVDGREGMEATAFEHRSPREHVVDVRSEDGQTHRIIARYLLDASGRDTFLAKSKKLARKNPKHQSAAIFGHFRDAQRRQGEDAGNISICSFEHGWMWMIPLPDGVMSVGAVCRPDYLKTRRGRPHLDFFMDTLKLHPPVWTRLQNAQLIDDKVHVAGNYSYYCDQLGGPGWMLVGDAYAFLDPVFSSGVYLAMSGAEQTAPLVAEALENPAGEAAAQNRLRKRLRGGMARMAYFIYRFNSPVMQRLFREPRNGWQVEQGVISMLAGDVFDSRPVWWRLQIFRAIYGLNVLGDWRRSRAERRDRLRQARATIE